MSRRYAIQRVEVWYVDVPEEVGTAEGDVEQYCIAAVGNRVNCKLRTVEFDYCEEMS